MFQASFNENEENRNLEANETEQGEECKSRVMKLHRQKHVDIPEQIHNDNNLEFALHIIHILIMLNMARKRYKRNKGKRKWGV